MNIGDEKTAERQRHKAQASVVTVGDGRGFVVKYAYNRLVVTAAHCLPFFPPCHGASYLEERTYGALLAPLGREPAVFFYLTPISGYAAQLVETRDAQYQIGEYYY